MASSTVGSGSPRVLPGLCPSSSAFLSIHQQAIIHGTQWLAASRVILTFCPSNILTSQLMPPKPPDSSSRLAGLFTILCTIHSDGQI